MNREERITAVLASCFAEMQPEHPEPPNLEEANYTALALVANRQVPYMWAWELPDTMLRRSGYEDPLAMFSELSEEQLEAVIRYPRCAHRLPRTMARLSKGTAKVIAESYGGDFRNLYRGQAISEVLKRLMALPGYGRKLARLALRYIVVDWCAFDLGEVTGSRSEVDAAPDRHVCRVLCRLGLIPSTDPDLAVESARRISSDAPYLVDGAFLHGTTVCRATPECDMCRLRDDCPTDVRHR